MAHQIAARHIWLKRAISGVARLVASPAHPSPKHAHPRCLAVATLDVAHLASRISGVAAVFMAHSNPSSRLVGEDMSRPRNGTAALHAALHQWRMGRASCCPGSHVRSCLAVKPTAAAWCGIRRCEAAKPPPPCAVSASWPAS